MGSFIGTFQHNGEKFIIEQPSLEYLSTIDPEFEWDQRGFKASTYDSLESKKVNEKLVKKLKKEMKSEKFQNRLYEFKQKSLTVYKNFLNNEFDRALANLKNKPFYFVIGPPRTGGTYVLRELYRIQNRKLTIYNTDMAADHMPPDDAYHKFDSSRGQNRRINFGLAQWIVWARQELSSFDLIPNKSIWFAKFLPKLDRIFQNESTYIVTHRSPGEMFQSYMQRFDVDYEQYNLKLPGFKYSVLDCKELSIDDETWENISKKEKFLLYWMSHYMYIAKFHNSIKGKIKNLSFGTNYEHFLEKLASDFNFEYTPEPFEPSSREPDDFWSSEFVRKKIKEINSIYADKFSTKPYDI